MAVMEQVDHVRWYRVIQTAPERVLVKLGWDPDASADQIAENARRIETALHDLLGADMQLDLEDAGEFRVEIGEKAPLVKGLPGQELEKLAERGYRLSF